MTSDVKTLNASLLVTLHLSHVTVKIGAHGQIRTDTGDALNVVPLLVGLHEQEEHLRPVSITGLLPAKRDRSSAARSEVKHLKWSACRVTLPGPALI